MKTLAFAAFTAVVITSGASAMPLGPVGQTPTAQNVALVCDQYGRCVRQIETAPRYYDEREEWRERRQWRERREWRERDDWSDRVPRPR